MCLNTAFKCLNQLEGSTRNLPSEQIYPQAFKQKRNLELYQTDIQSRI